jgi:hypothetical protein
VQVVLGVPADGDRGTRLQRRPGMFGLPLWMLADAVKAGVRQSVHPSENEVDRLAQLPLVTLF